MLPLCTPHHASPSLSLSLIAIVGVQSTVGVFCYLLLESFICTKLNSFFFAFCFSVCFSLVLVLPLSSQATNLLPLTIFFYHKSIYNTSIYLQYFHLYVFVQSRCFFCDFLLTLKLKLS